MVDRRILSERVLGHNALLVTAVSHQLAVLARQNNNPALLATPSFFRRVMANSSEGLPSPLPDEFAAALRRATDRTLNALHSLRLAVREHVQEGRSRGASQDEVDAELTSMIITASGDVDNANSSSDRVKELTRQVLKWSEAFYSRSS